MSGAVSPPSSGDDCVMPLAGGTHKAVLAIVVPDLFHASVTFFHEHIAQINPGQTVVVHLSSTGAPAKTDVPVVEIAEPTSIAAPRGLLGLPLRQLNILRQARLGRQREQQIEQFFKQHGVTHILAEFATSGVMILPLAKKLGLPLAVISHGWDINVIGTMPQWRWHYRRLFHSSARLIAVVPFLRGRMAAIGAPLDRVAVIPCALDVQSFQVTQHGRGPCRVVMVSRLTAQKGPLNSLRAFAIAAALIPDLSLDIVGNGPLMADLVREISRLGIADKVIVHGDQTHRNTLAIMSASHIFLQHCRSLPRQGIESQAVSLLEAMGHGLVPIVTAHGGMTDHVGNGARGWVIPEGDEAAMAERIVDMASNFDTRTEIGAAARHFVRANFSRDVVYPQLRRYIGLPPAQL